MKNIILTCLLALSASLFVSAEHYNALYAGYAGIQPVKDIQLSNKNVNTLNGFEVGYLMGVNFGKSKSAIEFGIAMGYNTWQGRQFQDKSFEKSSIHQWTIKVPVNITYKFDCSSMFAIAPYVGVNARFNPYHRLKVKTMVYDYDTDLCTYNTVGSSDGMKKFQAGCQVGAKFYWQKFFVYGQYGYDFLALYGSPVKSNSGNFSAGIGYSF